MSDFLPPALFHWENGYVSYLINFPFFSNQTVNRLAGFKTIIMKNEAKYISYINALAAQKSGEGIIIDVRESPEFKDGHIPYAVNLPSTQFMVEDYRAWHHLKIFLVCQSGSRARSIAQKLREGGMEEVYVLDRHMEQFVIEASSEVWSVDRQFRLVLGVFIALYLIGYHWMSALFSIIPVILGLGLIITAIIDKCYLRIAIAMLPWNREASEQLQVSN